VCRSQCGCHLWGCGEPPATLCPFVWWCSRALSCNAQRTAPCGGPRRVMFVKSSLALGPRRTRCTGDFLVFSSATVFCGPTAGTRSERPPAVAICEGSGEEPHTFHEDAGRGGAVPSTRQICPCPLPAAREEMSAKGLQGLVAAIVCGALCDGDTLCVSAFVLRLKNVFTRPPRNVNAHPCPCTLPGPWRLGRRGAHTAPCCAHFLRHCPFASVTAGHPRAAVRSPESQPALPGHRHVPELPLQRRLRRVPR
jgi:hypothetical protein